MAEQMAIRHPKRGKAHRPVPARHLYTGTAYTTAACGSVPYGSSTRLTERIPVERTDPSDRCKLCWPTPTPVAPATDTTGAGA